MNIVPKSINVYPFCAGCLSGDRVIKNLVNLELRVLFCDFLNDCNWLHSPEQPLLVCFECTAALVRFIRFRRQVKRAHNAFRSYLDNGVQPKCLSKLSIKNITTHNIESNNALHLKNEDLYNETIEKDVPNSKEKGINVASEIKNLNDTSENDKIEPVFVKMENKVEEVFLDDDFQNDDSENTEINIIKTETNSQDSDDEPLSNIKKKKCRKKRKTKEGAKKPSKPLQEDSTRVVYNSRVERVLRHLNVERGLIEMVVLSWDEVERERLEALSSEGYRRLQYRCERCALGYNHRVKLDNHLHKHDESSGDVMCEVCTIRFKNEKALYAHRRRHRVRWRCVPCGRTWSRAAVCADHASRAHAAPPPTHLCPHCDHTAPTLGKLKLHMRSHSEPVSCEICGKTYRDKDTLRTHLFIHRGEKEYECSKCAKKFLFKKALEIHQLSHGGSQYLYCHQCDVQFKNYLSYYQHMKYNMKHRDPNAIMHECGECGRRFARASRLHEHARAVHVQRDQRDVRCTHPGCHKSFSTRVSLRSHRASAHRPPPPAHTRTSATHADTTISKKSLESHMRSHTGERPYSCSVSPCAATFAHDGALYRHLKLVHRITSKKKQDSQTVTTTQIQIEN